MNVKSALRWLSLQKDQQLLKESGLLTRDKEHAYKMPDMPFHRGNAEDPSSCSGQGTLSPGLNSY
jgi:hypothetical protein